MNLHQKPSNLAIIDSQISKVRIIWYFDAVNQAEGSLKQAQQGTLLYRFYFQCHLIRTYIIDRLTFNSGVLRS